MEDNQIVQLYWERKTGLDGPPEETTYTDEFGNQVTQVEPDTVFDSTYEAAHALWGEGSRIVWFTTDKGFRNYMIYTPSIGTFSMYDGFYALTSQEVAEMNAFLQIK